MAAERWKQIAKDYLELAETFEALHASVHPRQQQQQKQQQQQPAADGDPSE